MIDRIFSVDHAFGRLELYVFGQDWPKAIRSTRNLVDKGPMFYPVLVLFAWKRQKINEKEAEDFF